MCVKKIRKRDKKMKGLTTFAKNYYRLPSTE